MTDDHVEKLERMLTELMGKLESVDWHNCTAVRDMKGYYDNWKRKHLYDQELHEFTKPDWLSEAHAAIDGDVEFVGTHEEEHTDGGISGGGDEWEEEHSEEGSPSGSDSEDDA